MSINTGPVAPICIPLLDKVHESIKVIMGIPNFLSQINDNMSSEQYKELTDEKLVEMYILRRLAVLGIYQDEESHKLLLSDFCTEGLARQVFCENGNPNLPVVRFKQIWSILKDQKVSEVKSEKIEGVEKLVDSIASAIKPMAAWGDKELIEKYNPECSSDIIDELDRRTKGFNFIVFSDEALGIPNVETTLRMLREVRRRGDGSMVHYKVGDSLKKLYRAGDFPSSIYNECPFHSNVLLVEGYCDECGHSWEGVNDDTRQFARITKEKGESPKDGPSIRQFISTARNGIEELSKDYPKVRIAYDDCKAEGKLPSLRRRTSSISNKTSDPFSPGNNRRI